MNESKKRFGGIERLYGQRSLNKLQNSHIAVIGIGGVGSWCAEALARSGVGTITLVDLDEVCITNTNRQIHALATTVGQSKVLIMAERMQLINPELKINQIEDFFTADSIESIFAIQFDGVIDAIDSLSNKALCIVACKERGIPLITIGAAGGRRDPLMVQAKDLGQTIEDQLLYRLRKKLRKNYDYPGGRKKFGVTAIFSQERPVYPTKAGGICESSSGADSVKLDCFSGLGSATHVTATFGMIAVSKIIEEVLSEKVTN